MNKLLDKATETSPTDVTINQTMDYDQFLTLEVNRKVSGGHKNNLVQSIARHNLLAYNPIMVTKKMEVIDGQHRLAAAKELGVPISYIVVPDANLSDIHLLNVNSEAWGYRDFLRFYVQQGYTDYRQVAELVTEYNLPIQTAVVLLTGLDRVTSRGRLDEKLKIDFQNGEFKVRDYEGAIKSLEQLLILKEFIVEAERSDLWRTRDWLLAVHQVLKQVEFDYLVDQFKASGILIKHTGNMIKDFIYQLEKVVNYNVKEPISLYE